MRRVLYSAAHSGFNLGEVPLGGGAAIGHHLAEEWTRQKPFDFEVLGPSLLGELAPVHKDLVRYSEFDYARFCQRFESRLTKRILQFDPKDVVVLSNDVAEGPDFKALGAQGYKLYTIYHVDVVDYFTTMYLRSWIKPETTTAFYRGLVRMRLSGLFPNVLKLIWEKQAASIRYSKGLIVPSQRMKEILLRCYPGLEPSRVHVLAWGMWENKAAPEEVSREKAAIRREFPMASATPTLLTLSRLSPEKGIDRLLKALAEWEKQADFPREEICLLIAGEPAFMKGSVYEEKLKHLAASLKKSHVYFVGFASGARKKALFELADLYVFPSRHESYGLTLLEALSEGKPVLTTPSYGSQEVFHSAFGEMIPPGPESKIPQLLIDSLKRLLSNRSAMNDMSAAGAAWAKNQKFSDTAAKLAALLSAN